MYLDGARGRARDIDQLAWIQHTPFSIWIRESNWAIFSFLIIHTIAMGFLTGTGAAINLRILGVAPRVQLSKLGRLLPIMLWATGVAIVSGILLVIGYPAKALTNWLFYVKLTILITVGVMTWIEARRLFPDVRYDLAPAPAWARRLALAALLLWAAAIPAGKFLAYTHKILLVY